MQLKLGPETTDTLVSLIDEEGNVYEFRRKDGKKVTMHCAINVILAARYMEEYIYILDKKDKYLNFYIDRLNNAMLFNQKLLSRNRDLEKLKTKHCCDDPEFCKKKSEFMAWTNQLRFEPSEQNYPNCRCYTPIENENDLEPGVN